MEEHNDSIFLSRKINRKRRAFRSNREGSENEDPDVKRRELETPHGVAPSGSRSFIAPVTWSAELNASGTALQLYQGKCYVATKDARVIVFDLDGAVEAIQQLPLSVENFMIDDGFLYAWCPQRNILGDTRGAVFDLSDKAPRRVTEVRNFGTLAVHCDLVDGLLVLADHDGSLMVQNLAGEQKWSKQQELTFTGLLLADNTGVYVGHKGHVNKYCLQNGDQIWSYDVTGRQYRIETCQQTESDIFFVVNGKLHQVNKESGCCVRILAPRRHKASGLGIGPNMIITGSCPSVIFDPETGEEKYRMNFAGRLGDGCMQFDSSGKTFTVWDKLYCLDLSPEGINKALEGRSRASKEYTVTTGSDVTEVRTAVVTKAGPDGAVVHVHTDGNGTLTATPTGSQYETDWPVLLPLPLMEEGRKFITEKLVPCEQQQLYRVRGHIYELKYDISNGKVGNTDETDDVEENEQKMEAKELEEEKNTIQDDENKPSANEENYNPDDDGGAPGDAQQ